MVEKFDFRRAIHVETRLQDLSETLNRTIIPKEELQTISQELSEIRKTLKETANTTHALSEEIFSESSMGSSLFGKTIGRYHSQEIDRGIEEIVDAALEILHHKGSITPSQLQKRIIEVQQKESLSPENRLFLTFAQSCLTLQTKQIELPLCTFYDGNKPIEPQLVTRGAAKEDDDFSDFAVELCELAEYFFIGDIQKAFQIYNTLPLALKEKLTIHIEKLGASLLTDQKNISLQEKKENGEKLASACFALAESLASDHEVSSYPSTEELRVIFEEVEQIREQDQ